MGGITHLPPTHNFLLRIRLIITGVGRCVVIICPADKMAVWQDRAFLARKVL